MNPLNDSQDGSSQGDNTFDMTNQRVVSARFGEFTTFNVFEGVSADRHIVPANRHVVPADRHVIHDASLTLLNFVDANMKPRTNEYHDYLTTSA